MPDEVSLFDLMEAARTWRLPAALPEPDERRDIRLRAGVSSTALAAACGVERDSVYRWEAGASAPRGAAALRYGRIMNALRQELVPA